MKWNCKLKRDFLFLKFVFMGIPYPSFDIEKYRPDKLI